MNDLKIAFQNNDITKNFKMSTEHWLSDRFFWTIGKKSFLSIVFERFAKSLPNWSSMKDCIAWMMMMYRTNKLLCRRRKEQKKKLKKKSKNAEKQRKKLSWKKEKGFRKVACTHYLLLALRCLMFSAPRAMQGNAITFLE